MHEDAPRSPQHALPGHTHLQALLDILSQRRSRRFAKGMTMQGPLHFHSSEKPQPLSEEEIAVLAFAACGITGHALAELPYQAGGGGSMMGSFLGRTVSSADAIHSVSVFISNDDGTFFLKRPQDFAPDEYQDVLQLSGKQDYVELYRKSRVQLSAQRLQPPKLPPYNLDVNQWDVYAPGTTYFVPVNDFTYMYINGLFEFLNESMGVFVIDERRGFRPAGLKGFRHLDARPASGRVITIERLEQILQSVCIVEQGMILQNLGMMAHTMGLGGFPNFAGHEFSWFDALKFQTQRMNSLQYLGSRKITQILATLFGKNATVNFPIGLEKDGQFLLKPYCPPHYPTMEAAVEAVIERKWGRDGLYGSGASASAWKDPQSLAAGSARPDQKTIDAVVAYCTYLYQTYGRFPAIPAPYRTNVGFQCGHLDLAFYEQYYRSNAIPEQFHRHDHDWHAKG